MSIFTRAQSMGIAALLLGISVFLSRFMGLLRDKIISYYHGAGAETDVYFASFAIPDFINHLLAGGYFSITLIPLLSRFFKEDENLGWRFFSAAFWWVCIAIFSLTAIAWVFADPLSRVAAPGFSQAERIRLIQFLRIILPAQACFLPGACFTALLFMRRQFTIPALTPLVYNSCIIICGLIFIKTNPEKGMEGFCWGVLIGAALGSLLLPWLAARAGGLRLLPVLKHPGIKSFVLLALPLMVGQSIVVLDEQFIRIFGSLGPEGSVSLLNYARRVMMVPVGVVAQAAGVASYPFLSSLLASGDREGFNRTINRTLCSTLGLIIPLSLWMMACARPTMRLIFEQGRFSAEAGSTSSVLLVIMLCSVGFWAVQQVLGRGFYANENTILPVVVGSVATLAGLPFYFFLGRELGAVGVAVAGATSMAIYTVLLVQSWKVHFGYAALRGLKKRVSQLVLCSLPAGFLSYLCINLALDCIPGNPLLSALFSIAFGFPPFILPYLVLCRIFSPEIWYEIKGLVTSKLKK